MCAAAVRYAHHPAACICLTTVRPRDFSNAPNTGSDTAAAAAVMAPPPLPRPQQPRRRPVRMVPLSEGARGRSVCVALPCSRGEEPREGGSATRLEDDDDDEGEEGDGVAGGIYIATALSCRKLADSWALYLGSLR